MRVPTPVTAAVTAAVTALSLALASPAAGASREVTGLQPQNLERGSDIAIAHIEGDDLVTATQRVDLPGAEAVLLGASGRAHVVGTVAADGNAGRTVLRVQPDGTTRTLLRGVHPYTVKLSEDGRRLVQVGSGRRGSVVRVWSARTGALQHSRRFKVYVTHLTTRGPRVLLTEWDRGTLEWDFRAERVSRLTRRPAATASIEHDLLATYTGDPFEGGCSVLTRLDTPDLILWRSCTERVAEISPDGERIATVHLLSDGIGPSQVWQRTVRGTLLSSYRTAWFGRIEWESPSTMLLEVNGRTTAATVRCRLADCENATDPEPVTEPRPSPGPNLLRT